MTPDPVPVSYSIPGAAAALGVGKSTVWRMIADGQLETFKLGHRTLILRTTLLQLVERLSRQQAA